MKLNRLPNKKDCKIKEVTPLRIEGIRTELTPRPDDAELAAEALLTALSDPSESPRKGRPSPPSRDTSTHGEDGKGHSSLPAGEGRGGAYYRALAERIREGRAMEARQAMRFVAYCEMTLKTHPLTPPAREGSALAPLERDLYNYYDIVQREGGELLRRWQHCLAEITVRLMDQDSSPPE